MSEPKPPQWMRVPSGLRAHNLRATEVEDCDACLDILTHPKRGGSDSDRLASVNRAHSFALRLQRGGSDV